MLVADAMDRKTNGFRINFSSTFTECPHISIEDLQGATTSKNDPPGSACFTSPLSIDNGESFSFHLLSLFVALAEMMIFVASFSTI